MLLFGSRSPRKGFEEAGWKDGWSRMHFYGLTRLQKMRVWMTAAREFGDHATMSMATIQAN